MSFRCLLLICFKLSLFAGQGLAQTDSVYSRMILGSAGYKTIFGGPDKYARSQKIILERLTSSELAERAVRKCFSEQQTQPTGSAFKVYAKKCAAALKVNTSGDTAALAFGDPKINGIVPTFYLDNLMMILLEDNQIFALDANSGTLDSLGTLADSAYMVMMHTHDTLISFCNTPEFRSATHELLFRLFDTVAVFKKSLLGMGYDAQTVANMFRQLDTAMHRFRLAYEDTLSGYWAPKYAGAGIAVYDCEHILTVFRCNLNATLSLLADTNKFPSLNDQERGTMYYVFHEILTSDKVQHFYNYSYIESRTPPGNKTFSAVNLRYRANCEAYRRLLNARSGTMVQRACIVPGSYILCIASKVKC